jgi:hypothetical protein
MGFNDPNNFGPDMRTLQNAAFNSVTGPADVPSAFQAAQAADPIFAGSRHDPVSGWVAPPTYGPFVGGYGNYAPPSSGSDQPASPISPAAGVGPPTSSTNLFSGGDYSGLSANQLPLSNQSPGEAAGFQGQSGYIPPAPMQAATVAGGGPASNLISGFINAVKTAAPAVVSAIHSAIPQSLQYMNGITGFGGGPTPGGVTDKASFTNWLGGQSWHGASLYNANGSVNPSGGSAYNYFSPSTPGGIGGYVANGQVFTYPTEDTQNFFHTAGN